jgi:hypothetical protein
VIRAAAGEWAGVAEKLEASYFLKYPLQPQIQQWQAIIKPLGDEAVASLTLGSPAGPGIDARIAKTLSLDPKQYEETTKQAEPFSYSKSTAK